MFLDLSESGQMPPCAGRSFVLRQPGEEVLPDEIGGWLQMWISRKREASEGIYLSMPQVATRLFFASVVDVPEKNTMTVQVLILCFEVVPYTAPPEPNSSPSHLLTAYTLIDVSQSRDSLLFPQANDPEKRPAFLVRPSPPDPLPCPRSLSR